MKKAMYIGILGNLLMLAGMLCSFLMIQTEESEDYTAKIFAEWTMGPVETEDGEEAQTAAEDEETTQDQQELKGYGYSLVGYLCQKTPDKDNTGDIELLQQFGELMDNYNLEELDLSSEELVQQLKDQYQAAGYEEMEQVLEKYEKADITGIIFTILAVVALGVAVWLLLREDYRWSMLFSLIATAPLWRLLVKMDGITQWQVQYGFFLYVAGILAVLVGGLMGGNAEQ